jgi:leucyl-tRNA synthetase
MFYNRLLDFGFAEQYAIQTGQRPEDTTSVNIDGGYDKKEIKLLDMKTTRQNWFSFDWVEVRTSNPIITNIPSSFLSIIQSWYLKDSSKGRYFNYSCCFKKGNAT